MKYYQFKITALILLFAFLISKPVYSQIYDIDPYLQPDKAANNTMLTDYGYVLSLFLNSFEPARGNLMAGVKWGMIGKRTWVNIKKDSRNGILAGRERWDFDMIGAALALSPSINFNVLFHQGRDGGRTRLPLSWQATLKYDYSSRGSLNHLIICSGYGEFRYVQDFFLKQFTIEGLFNGQSRRLGYTVGVGVNRFLMDIHPDGMQDDQYFSKKIIKNVFKYSFGLQFNFQRHWQFITAYTKAYFTSYQLEIVFYL